MCMVSLLSRLGLPFNTNILMVYSLSLLLLSVSYLMISAYIYFFKTACTKFICSKADSQSFLTEKKRF